MSLNRSMSLLELEQHLERDARENAARQLLQEVRIDWLDDVTLLAQKATGLPVAFVSVLDAHHTYFVASRGAELVPAPRSSTLCELVASSGRPVVIPDASQEPVLARYPAVRDGLRTYVGVPVDARTHHDVSFSLCVADAEPHADAARAVEVLEALARVTASLLVQQGDSLLA